MAPVAEREPEDPQVEGTSLDSRTVMLVSAGLVALFGGLALWSLRTPDASALDAAASAGAVMAARGGSHDTAAAGSTGVVTPGGADPVHQPIVSGRLLEEPRKVSSLLGQKFQHRRPDGSTVFTTLRGVLSARGVTVVNVWATYCEPCKREFPGFRELQKGWGNNVQFLPIQLGEGESGSLRDVMPVAPDQLVDYTPGGAVQGELAKLGELPLDAPIPITMLLDCRQELRWVQQGEVKNMQEFEDAVQVLREELRSPKCAARTASDPADTELGPKTAPMDPKMPTSPCRKTRCKENQTCTRRYDGVETCLDALE